MISKLWNWFTGRISIRKKLIISFTVLVSIPIITLGTYAFAEAKENLIEQTQATMANNLSRLVIEMETRFQRENDFMKFQAYNLEFRENLEKNPFNNVKIAQALNQSVEPVLWYFITSDINIKGIKMVTPFVEREIGAFLEPAVKYKEEEWYRRHESNFNTVWTVEEGRLYASRTILDTATTSQLIGVMRTEFYLNRFLEPITSMNYLENGIRVLDADNRVIYERTVGNEGVERKVDALLADLNAGNNYTDNKVILMSAVIPNSEWKIYYYIDKGMISEQVSSIILSTLFMVSVCIAVVFIFISLLSGTLSRRILILKKHAEEISAGNLDNPCYTTDMDEIGVVTNSLGKMTERLNATINQVYKIEIEKKEAELQALQAMINPHFLYNCLSSIKWKALRKGDDEISEITGLIAKFYRTALNNGSQITSVKSEIENIKAYVEIQRTTHDNSFDVEYDIEEEGLEYTMLNFLLQPIVENAIKHGIDYKEEEDSRGFVRIVYRQEGEFLIFDISNNGPEMELERLSEILDSPGKGYGIFNIQERIALYYGGECGLSAHITEEGYTCFSVKIYKVVKGNSHKVTDAQKAAQK